MTVHSNQMTSFLYQEPVTSITKFNRHCLACFQSCSSYHIEQSSSWNPLHRVISELLITTLECYYKLAFN